MRNPFTYTFLFGLMAFGPTPLAFAGGLGSRNCCPTRRVVVPAPPQVRVNVQPQPQRQQQTPSKPSTRDSSNNAQNANVVNKRHEYRSGYRDGYNAARAKAAAVKHPEHRYRNADTYIAPSGQPVNIEQTVHVDADDPGGVGVGATASAVARMKLQLLAAEQTLEDAREIGQMAQSVSQCPPPQSQTPQPGRQPGYFDSPLNSPNGNGGYSNGYYGDGQGYSQTAAYPASNTQFATFQEVFQPQYHEIIDRSVRASENATTLNTQVLREAVSGALEISKIEQAIAEAEVEVKRINAQAHLLATSRDRQSISTFGTAPLSSVQQGNVRASVGVGPVDSPNYGGALRDGNQCAVCHSINGGGANAAALQSFDVEALTVESAQRAIESMYDGSMPKGQARYSLEEIRKTKSQLEAALGVALP